MKKLLSAMALAAISSMAAAETETVSTPGEWEFGGYVGQVMLDSGVADFELIDDTAITFGGTANFHKNNLVYSLGLEYMVYDDNNEFTVRVRNYYTDRETNEDSSASALVVYGAIGPRWQWGEEGRTRAYVQGGISAVFASDRSVQYCDNCPSEDIDIEGGAFGKATIEYSFSAVSLTAAYTHYIGSDIDGSIVIGVATPF